MAVELLEILGTLIVLALLVVGLPVLFLGPWLVVSSWRVAGSKWFDRAVRSLAVITVIPAALLLILMIFVAVALLFIPQENHPFFAICTVLVAVVITLGLQGAHTRNMIRDDMQDHKMGLREYVIYIFRGQKRAEKTRKKEVAARAEQLYNYANIWQRRTAPTPPQDPHLRQQIAVAAGPLGMQRSLIPEFALTKKVVLAMLGAAQILAFALFAGAVLYWPTWPMIVVPMVIWLIAVFLAGFIPIETHESPAIVLFAPLIGILEFMFIAIILDVFPWLDPPLDHLYYAFALTILYLFVLAVPSLLAVLLGKITYDSLLARDILPQSYFRTAILGLSLIIEVIAIVARFRFHYPDDEPLIGLLEFMAIGAITIALTAPRTQRRERQLAGCIAPIVGSALLVVLGLLDLFYLAISPFLGILLVLIITGADEADLSGTNISPLSCAKLSFLSFILISGIYYVGTSAGLLLGQILIAILAMGGVMAYFTGGMRKESSLIISWVSVYGLIEGISWGLLPTHSEMQLKGIGWVSLPFAITFWIALTIGSRIHEHYVFVGADGHHLSSKGELFVDDWLSRNSIAHEVHPVLEDKQLGRFQLSFKLAGELPLYVHVWKDIRKEKNLQYYNRISATIKKLGIEVVEIFPSDINIHNLDAFLGHIKEQAT